MRIGNWGMELMPKRLLVMVGLGILTCLGKDNAGMCIPPVGPGETGRENIRDVPLAGVLGAAAGLTPMEKFAVCRILCGPDSDENLTVYILWLVGAGIPLAAIGPWLGGLVSTAAQEQAAMLVGSCLSP
jgi:hypothetical protein